MHDLTTPPPSLLEIMDTAPAGVLAAAADGRILYANAALGEMFGYSQERLQGMNVDTLLPERLRSPCAGQLTAFFTAPQSRGTSQKRELQGLHAAGHEIRIEVGLGYMSHLGERSVIAFVSDLSPRQPQNQTQNQTQNQNQGGDLALAGIVQALPLGLLMVGVDGRISMTNRAVAQMFGYAEEELNGQMLEILLPAGIRTAHPGLRGGFFANPAVRRMGEGRDLLAQRKDGHEFPVEIALTPVTIAGVRQVLAAVSDISVRKKNEAALLQMNAQLEEFTYIASHDLRSPLRGIADLLSWIREDLSEAQLTEAVRNNLDRASLRVQRTERMIEDLLDYAKAGQADGRICTIAPLAFLQETLAVLPTPLGFTLELAGHAAPFAAAATPLALVLRNLVNNAFTHHGGETGLVRVSVQDDCRCIIFTVEDDGAGVPPGAEDRIFKLFQRSTTRAPGHGVGLAVSRRVTHANGGNITLQRNGTLGGACFCVTWPRFPSKEQE